MELLLLLLGFFGGFIAGLLGLGGAVFMIPLLLYIPSPVIGQSLSAQQTAAISVVYVLAASLSGLLHHLHHKYVNYKIILFVGGGIFCGAFLGGFISDYLATKIILAVFGAMTVFATALIFLPINDRSEVDTSSADISFNRLAALLTGLAVGIISGIAGLGGGIILIPVMIHLFQIPTRFAIGSNLGIVFLSALAGLAGKEITGQIPWILAAALVAGAFPGAQLGAHVSCMIKTRYLRIGIHLLIAMAGIRIWYQVFAGH